MTATTFVMLIWVGVSGNIHSGAAATIPGFSSMLTCDNAIPRVKKFYDGYFYTAVIECVQIDQ